MPKKATKSATPLALHTVRFPGENPRYRAARNKLLKREIMLRREIEAVATERRKLPLGGTLREDYVFDSADGQVRLSDLLGAGKDPLIWPLWNLFDLTPEGRGTTWNPKLSYD